MVQQTSYKYRTEVAEDGSTTSLIVNVNGTDYTVGTGISAAYKVEVCDLNTSDNQLNIVVVGTGTDNSVTMFPRIKRNRSFYTAYAGWNIYRA